MSEVASPTESCQYCHGALFAGSKDARSRLLILLRKYWWRARGYSLYMIKLGPIPFASIILPRTGLWKRIFRRKVPMLHDSRHVNSPNRLKVGDLVEVRSAKEILVTLDEGWKLRGLVFMPEMVRFAGRRFRVRKIVRKIMMESNGELRTIRNPTVLLDGVFCDGASHGGCDRSCFCFWREEWLRKVAESPRGFNDHG